MIRHLGWWYRWGGAVAAACLAGLLLLGCEEDVIAVLGTEEAFSLYGVLTPQADTQFIRVFPIEGRLEAARPEPLDVQFTSLDLESGETRTWRDSIIIGTDRQYGHVFWSPFRAVHQHRYRLAVVGPDAATSSVEVRMPSEAVLKLGEPVLTGGVVQPVFIEGDVPNLIQIDVTYQIKFGFGPGTELDVRLPYGGQQQRTAEGWRFNIVLSDDYNTLRLMLQAAQLWSPSFQIVLLGLRFRLIVANEEWAPPGGVFDPRILVQPGTMTNVENGFGFVGAGYRLETVWRPADDVAEAAGFRLLPEEESPNE